MSSTGTTTKAGTITRADALIRQINLVVQGTTGSTTFRYVIEQGVNNRWIKTVTINGLTREGKIRQQIEIEIDWTEHALRLTDPNKGEITVNLAIDERNWISSVIGQIIDGFNEIKEQGDLEAVWLVSYTPEARAREAEVDRILGLKTAEPRDWEQGQLELILDKYRPRKLSEAVVSWKVITKS
ncbi:MAG: hypothetical protein Kow00123_02120 [Anaerolineales bacterium]